MNTAHLKTYAPEARKDFIAAVMARAAKFGIAADHIEPITEQGDVALIGDKAYPRSAAENRRKLEAGIRQQGFEQVMEAMAYTWFNRFMAIRYMELHGYLDHGRRVLSHPNKKNGFEILDDCAEIELPGVDRNEVVELKLAGNKDEELYRLLLLGQCHALHQAMPFLFEAIEDDTELLLPDNLTKTNSLIRHLVDDIPEDNWDNIEIIGWLYQFYISEKKDQVIGKVVKSEDIPAATQLFTPNWIVKYMVQNSLGAQWLATYPNSPLKGQMEYYIEPAEQTDEVNAQLAAITPSQLNPEELTLIDPASGSGHILVEAYELFKAIYLERGYRQRDVPKLILEKNLFGLDIDERAAQLTGFALMMKGRADDRRLFERGVKLNVMALVDSAGFDAEGLAQNEQVRVELSDYGLKPGDLTELRRLFEHATTFGSLIQVPEELALKLPVLKQLSEATSQDLFVSEALKRLGPLVRQAELLAAQYDAVVANPPYMGGKGMNAQLKRLANDCFPGSRSDLFAVSTERFLKLIRRDGFLSLMTPYTWMFLESYEALRRLLLNENTLRSLIQPEYHAIWSSAAVPICTFTVQTCQIEAYYASFVKLSDFRGSALQPLKTLEAIKNPECGWFYRAKPDDFKKIPGSPVAYWVPTKALDAFVDFRNIGSISTSRQGLITGDNDRFLRVWQEVEEEHSNFACKSRGDSLAGKKTWFPFQKGGSFRKWYGNHDYLVNWKDDGYEIRNFCDSEGMPRSRPRAMDYYFRPGITWTSVTIATFNCRLSPMGFIYSEPGPLLYADDASVVLILAGFLNSNVANSLLQLVAPLLHYNKGHISALPMCEISGRRSDDLELAVTALTEIARLDWNAYERSWDFQSLPILTASFETTPTLESSYTAWITQNRDTIAEMKRLEEENNRLFIDAYGLTDELSPDVPIEQITLTVNPAYRYGGKLTEEEQWTRFRQDTMEELVSYAIGCMMGRYSLDKPGLILANAGDNLMEYDRILSDWHETLAGRPVDIHSTFLKENAEIECFRCGALLASEGVRLVLARYEDDKPAGRPLLYCKSCTEETKQRISKETPLRDFDYAKAIREKWFEPETGAIFLELAGCFVFRPTAGYTSRPFRPDDDGIVPLTDTAWFDDDATHRLIEFISVAWAESHLEANITFLADNLSPRKTESSRETIRRYLCDKLFKDHLRTYKKRPIYWLFSSGKQKAFQCLVYLHRYNEGTLARMRTEYAIPLQGKMSSRIEQLDNDIAAASSTAHRKKLEKERDKLAKQRVELQEFDEKLRHYADQQIHLDLDDGVKVNYGKFGDLLAEVKAIHGKKPTHRA